ncbi:hypothetical protein BZA05DRAFT_436010 [Tricharina praecox]|uniref:uncharacterized protein n=1 Tax=Tricharina praecox TaxID=43433 RepID=UPI00221FB945|nr:uncharacterized protein BZA05DRAFT_436010 [Tricharina praecox]KAI5852109.1 hypothetical protein BZA05DRAFT_436010 [Tricharina praecox]
MAVKNRISPHPQPACLPPSRRIASLASVPVRSLVGSIVGSGPVIPHTRTRTRTSTRTHQASSTKHKAQSTLLYFTPPRRAVVITKSEKQPKPEPAGSPKFPSQVPSRCTSSLRAHLFLTYDTHRTQTPVTAPASSAPTISLLAPCPKKDESQGPSRTAHTPLSCYTYIISVDRAEEAWRVLESGEWSLVGLGSGVSIGRSVDDGIQQPTDYGSTPSQRSACQDQDQDRRPPGRFSPTEFTAAPSGLVIGTFLGHSTPES